MGEPEILLLTYARKFLEDEEHYLKQAKLLLEREDLDVNAQDEWGRTALNIAAAFHRKNDNFVEILLDHPDINVNLRDRCDQTPLWNACANVCSGNSSTKIVKRLLAYPEIDVNCSDWDRVSALKISIRKHNLEIIEALLAHPKIVPDDNILSFVIAVSKDLILPIMEIFAKSKKVSFHEFLSTVRSHIPSLSVTIYDRCIGFIVNQLLSNRIERLVVPCICSLSLKNRFIILNSLQRSQYLKSVEFKYCNTARTFMYPRLYQSFSICDIEWNDRFNISYKDENVEMTMIRQNKAARQKCYNATIFTLFALKEALGKDVTKIIAQHVWSSRGTGCWRSKTDLSWFEMNLLMLLTEKYGQALQISYDKIK